MTKTSTLIEEADRLNRLAKEATKVANRALRKAKLEIIKRIMVLAQPYLYETNFSYRIAILRQCELTGQRTRNLAKDKTSAPNPRFGIQPTYEGIVEGISNARAGVIDELYMCIISYPMLEHSVDSLLQIERDLQNPKLWDTSRVSPKGDSKT